MEHNFTPIEFAQLLASRICHDLISPISAVNNGLELLSEGDDHDEESKNYAMDIIEDSAKLSAIKLKIMRAAFGAGQIFPNQCRYHDIAELVNELAEKNKVSLCWNHCDDKFFTPNKARELINILLIALEALPRGGKIFIDYQDNMTLNIEGEKLIFPEDKINYLNKTQEIPAEPRLIGFILLKMMKVDIHCQKSDNKLIFTLA